MKCKFLLVIILSNVSLQLSAAEVGAGAAAAEEKKISFEQQLLDILSESDTPTKILATPLKKLIVDYLPYKFAFDKTIDVSGSAIFSLLLLPNGNLAVGHTAGYINIINDYGQFIQTIGTGRGVLSLLSLPDGTLAAGCNEVLQFWNINNLRLTQP